MYIYVYICIYGLLLVYWLCNLKNNAALTICIRNFIFTVDKDTVIYIYIYWHTIKTGKLTMRLSQECNTNKSTHDSEVHIINL